MFIVRSSSLGRCLPTLRYGIGSRAGVGKYQAVAGPIVHDSDARRRERFPARQEAQGDGHTESQDTNRHIQKTAFQKSHGLSVQ